MDFLRRIFNSPEVDEKVGVIRFKVWSDLWDQKARTIQTVLAIAIGAIAVGASLGASRMIAEGLRQGWLDSSPSMISLEVDPPVDEATVDSITSIEGVVTVEGEMVLPAIKWRRSPDELWTPAQLIARQDYQDIQLNEMVLVSGDWPERKLMNVESGHDMQAGDQLELQIRHQTLGERTHPVAFNGTVFNVLAPPPASGGVPTFYTTRSQFAEVTGEEGFRIIRASAAEYDRTAVTKLTAKIQDHLKKQGHESQGAFPFGLAVTDPNEHIFNELMVSMYVLLIGMGLLSLVLGLLLVFITMTALISQQIEQIGIMKAIGARRRLIFHIYLSSVLVYGTLALLLALLPGALGAYGVYAGFMYYLNYDPGGFQVSWPAVTVQAAITFLAPMLAALKPIRTGANITVREAISTYGLGGASTLLEKFLAKFKTFPELLALMLSNTFRNRQRAILIMVTLIISGVIFMTVMSLGASMSYTYDDLLRTIYKFDVTFSFVDRQRINRVEAVTLDHPSTEMVEMWNVSGAAARPISQVEKSINDKTVQVLGVPVPTALYGPDVREGRWLEPEDTYAVVLNQRMAWELEADVGDMLTFNFGPNGDSDWQVVGIAFDPVLITSAHVPRDTLERELGGKADTVFNKLKPDYDPAATAPELRDHYEANGLRVSTTTIFFTVDTLQQMIEMAELEISTLIALLSAMAVMMAIVGSIGLGSVLAINVLERRREIGVMRAIGASNKIISRQLIGEGLTLGLLSWLIAVPLSIPASWLMNFALGWTMKIEFTFIFSYIGVFIWLVITLVLSVLASWLPARRAVLVSVRESLAYQ